MVIGVHTDYDLGSWAPAARDDQRPGIAPFGLEHLSCDGIELRQLSWPAWKDASVGRALRRGENRMDFPLARTFLSQRTTEHVDVALAVLERQGYPHAMLRRAGLRPWSRTPLALLTCWLAEDARRATALQLRRLRLIAGGADLYIFWSTNQAAIFRHRLNIPEDRLFFVPFGVEAEFYRPVAGSGDYVLTVGSDRGRDYANFLEAVARVDVPVKIACPSERLNGLKIPKNVEFLGVVDHVRYRDLLQNAAVVVVPSRPEVAYPTGQSVLLNAMSCQRPTVVTSGVALADYVRDGENTCAVEPQDGDALRDGIERVLRDREFATQIAAGGRADVERLYNTRTMWSTIAARLHELAP